MRVGPHIIVRRYKYLSIKYTKRLSDAGIEPSVGSVGDSYDNALAETINGLFKAEVIHRRGPWRNCTAPGFSDTRRRYAASCVVVVLAIQVRLV